VILIKVLGQAVRSCTKTPRFAAHPRQGMNYKSGLEDTERAILYGSN
jgi:hypothetical protein